jgi:hypothetical protein
MNYILPLNCYLPRKIDEISYINYLSDQPHNPEFYTKLNIITEKGADVTVNGETPDSQYGPHTISQQLLQIKNGLLILSPMLQETLLSNQPKP